MLLPLFDHSAFIPITKLSFHYVLRFDDLLRFALISTITDRLTHIPLKTSNKVTCSVVLSNKTTLPYLGIPSRMAMGALQKSLPLEQTVGELSQAARAVSSYISVSHIFSIHGLLSIYLTGSLVKNARE